MIFDIPPKNRYVGNLASYRGPVGVEIAVQGRGFTSTILLYSEVKKAKPVIVRAG